jgi:hypothetical protein
MGMTQIAAPVAPADEIDRRGRLLQFHFERSHERIFGRHGHAVANAGDVEPNGELVVGEFIAGHCNVSLMAAFGQTDNGSPGRNVAAAMDAADAR